MRTVKFDMYYTVCGRTEMQVPDGIPDEGILQYLKDHTANIILPYHTEYVAGSDRIDETSPIEIIDA